MSKQEQIEAVETTFNMVNLVRLREHMARLSNVETPVENLLMWTEHKGPVGFNMGTFYPGHCTDKSPHQCGTSCCLAGHSYLLMKNEDISINLCRKDSGSDIGVYEKAREWLNLTHTEANFLFYGRHATLEEVIDLLDYMISNGIVPPPSKRRSSPLFSWNG